MNQLLCQLKSLKDSKAAKGKVNSTISTLIGLVIVIVIIVAVAPTLFNGTNNITGAPSFFNTVFPIMIAAGVIFLVWRAVSPSK